MLYSAQLISLLVYLKVMLYCLSFVEWKKQNLAVIP